MDLKRCSFHAIRRTKGKGQVKCEIIVWKGVFIVDQKGYELDMKSKGGQPQLKCNIKGAFV